MPYPTIDLSLVRTYPLPQRENRVNLEDLITPETPVPSFDNPELAEVASRIIQARSSHRPVIWMMGAHVIKRGLAPILIDLLRKGVITHLASNGAATIHDFEIALQGHTSEDVSASLADGSFGMAEETGAFMNRAIADGAFQGIGIGEALGKWIAEHPEFRHREYSVLYQAFRLGIPYTVHVAIGTDIIHQHPSADFAAIGWASGQDFKCFARAVCELENGVFLNFGSAVIGPEVFLKALSIARNLGNPVRVFTTANFDLVHLDDYRSPIGEDQVAYYYRPRKNIVNRPVMLGGKGFHISGDHRVTIPNLYRLIPQDFQAENVNQQVVEVNSSQQVQKFNTGSLQADEILQELKMTHPALQKCIPALSAAFRMLVNAFSTSGTLFTCGNGGSMADALHISGELNKAFKLPRPIPARHAALLEQSDLGASVVSSLQPGLRTYPLGGNAPLTSAILNDQPNPYAGFAQELYALARPGDILMAISTSGRARNLLLAATVARAVGVKVIALTGEKPSPLSDLADLTIHAPAQDTPAVQGWHLHLYHALCAMLEAHFFTPGAMPQ
ncbi:MAG TPA: SIS domain-containing protein [Anaerolineaceae bacterium]